MTLCELFKYPDPDKDANKDAGDADADIPQNLKGNIPVCQVDEETYHGTHEKTDLQTSDILPLVFEGVEKIDDEGRSGCVEHPAKETRKASRHDLASE